MTAPTSAQEFVELVTCSTLSSDKLVLSVDPGLATGICVLWFDGDRPSLLASAELDWIEAVDAFKELVDIYGTRITPVAEKFTISAQTARNSQAPWSLNALGCLLWICHHADLKLTLQTPGDAKKMFQNETLRKLDCWHRGGEGHALDAIRHGLLFMARNGWTARQLLS